MKINSPYLTEELELTITQDSDWYVLSLEMSTIYIIQKDLAMVLDD